MSAITDPFHVVKGEITASVTSIQAQYDVWKTKIDSSSPFDSEIDRLQNEVLALIRSTEWDLEDAEQAVGVAESNRGRYRITDEELRARREFVNSTRKRLEGMRNALTDPGLRQRQEAEMRQQLAAASSSTSGKGAALSAGDRYKKMQAAIERDNDDYIRQEQQKQEMIWTQQDEDVTQLEDVVTRIKEIGVAIHEETKIHNELLTGLEEDVDRTQGRLQGAMKQLKKVMKSANNRGFICAIVILILVLVVMVILIFTL